MVCCTQAVKENVSEDVHSGSCGALAVSLFDDLNILFACRLKAQQRAAIGRIHTRCGRGLDHKIELVARGQTTVITLRPSVHRGKQTDKAGLIFIHRVV